jgi:hypothetical protein
MTGGDSSKVKASMNAGMQSTAILTEVILTVDGQPVPDTATFVAELPMRDRRKIMDLLSAHQPVIDTDIPIPCPSCGEEQIKPLTWGELFLI